MGDVLVLGHFDLLRVDDDEFHVGGRVAIKQGADESISHDRLTGTSSTGDEEVRHFGEICYDGFAGDVLPYREGEGVGRFLPFGGLENTT